VRERANVEIAVTLAIDAQQNVEVEGGATVAPSVGGARRRRGGYVDALRGHRRRRTFDEHSQLAPVARTEFDAACQIGDEGKHVPRCRRNVLKSHELSCLL
jgi:hypothetical protein